MNKKIKVVIRWQAFFILSMAGMQANAQSNPYFPWNKLPVKALLLSCPNPKDVPLLCDFIRQALPKEGVNTLCLRIEYQYKFQTHPELTDVNALSGEELQRIVAACREAHIRFIPTMNLLAHQSD